ncbi:unnamed protein product, partial [Candidula unifasciata]
MHLVPSFCGNGVVEKDEVCDAGIYGVINKDKCCTFDCKLRKHAFCSDKNKDCCQNCSMAAVNTQCSPSNVAECKAASYCT